MTSTSNRNRAPQHAALGRLFAADGESVRVSITHQADDLLLVILDDARDFFRGPLTDLMLESVASRGVLRTPGIGERLDPNRLRFILDEEPDWVQRRDFVRVTIAQRVLLEDEDGEVLANTLTLDISGGGMLVKLPRSFELEGDVFFTLFLGMSEYDEYVRGVGRVIRRRAEDQVAIGFKEISHHDRERLIRFVFERQRVALAKTRGHSI
jgi:hypothetical protein